VPGCDTVNVCPAMVTVPVRKAVVGLAATVYPTDPLPLPLAPEVTVIQLALLTPVHAQPADVVTVTVPVPPPATTDCVVGEIE
jgi:hypothetical protein